MTLPELWQTRGPLAVLLLPVAALYALVAALRRAAWRGGLLQPRHAGVPVIVVGNITAGGTGKTPLVLWLARHLQQQGRHPGILSRGYGSARRDPRAVPADGRAADCAEQYGDEPCLLARRAGCPVWVGADRAAVARALRAAHPECDVLVSDDGLQHYRLARDMEIAVIDGARGLGNGWPLPAGPLREPPARLAAVDAVVVNGGTWPGALAMRLEGTRLRSLQQPQRVVEAAQFHGSRVHAVAGIGHPPRFFDHLRSLGIDVVPHPFPDHHPYTAADLQFGDALPVVMTEKDAVKCAAYATDRHWVLAVDAAVDPRLGDLVNARLAQAEHHG